jgi:hypothetical protein
MGTMSVPTEFLTFDEKGKVKDIDMYGFLNYLPEKQKLGIVIKALRSIQEEQYQGFKKFSKNSPGNDRNFNKSYEAIGRMYFVLHSIEDDFNKL